jgi:hypothetical protein
MSAHFRFESKSRLAPSLPVAGRRNPALTADFLLGRPLITPARFPRPGCMSVRADVAYHQTRRRIIGSPRLLSDCIASSSMPRSSTLTFAFIILLSLGATSVSAAQDIPANAHRIASGWECNRGYARAGNECQPVILPANAALDYYGHGWDCNKGYKRVGNECEAVVVPANASLDYYGHSWDCNKGYKRVGNGCRSVAISDLPNALVTARPKGEESSRPPMPSQSSTTATPDTSAASESSLSQSSSQAVPDGVAPNVRKPKATIQRASAPRHETESRPQPQGRPDLVASNSPVQSLPSRPTLPAAAPAKQSGGSDNSFLILAGIFLAFGFLRLTGIVRP